MDSKTSSELLSRVRAKQADLTNTVQDMATTQLRSDAFKDVRNLFLASAGAGLAGRGGIGLINLLTKGRERKRRTGPAELAMPYPAAVPKLAGFWSGDAASTKGGIPWYYPAMMLSGMVGAGAGWKGLDMALESRRKKESEGQLIKARQGFHDALLSQYDTPKVAADKTTMAEVGCALDALWEKMAALLADDPKSAFDLGNAAGAGAGLYGTYAGLSGLLAGSVIYNQIKKRSRGAILDKALQRRRRREFMQRPTEIFATPEPLAAPTPLATPPPMEDQV